MIQKQDQDSGFWEGSSGGVKFGALPIITPLLCNGLSLRYPRQVHGNVVLDDDTFGHCRQAADGLVSKKNRLALIIRTADCIPLHIWDEDRIGMIHAGWRSIRGNIISRSIQDFKTNKTKIVVGPSITARHYEVDRDLYEPWLLDWPSLENFLSPPQPQSTKRFLDLRRLAVAQLQQAGIREENIHLIDRCTFASTLPSYRREGPNGRRIYNYIYRLGS